MSVLSWNCSSRCFPLSRCSAINCGGSSYMAQRQAGPTTAQCSALSTYRTHTHTPNIYGVLQRTSVRSSAEFDSLDVGDTLSCQLLHDPILVAPAEA